MSRPEHELIRALAEANAQASRMLKLYSLHKQYVTVLEHLHLINGGITIDGYPYNQNFLGRGARSYLNDCRDILLIQIEEEEAVSGNGRPTSSSLEEAKAR